MNELETNTEYVVRLAAKNVVGYSEFTVREVSTEDAPETKEKQKDLPGSIVDWIIGVIIALAALIVLIVAIAIHRRRRARSQEMTSDQEVHESNN